MPLFSWRENPKRLLLHPPRPPAIPEGWLAGRPASAAARATERLPRPNRTLLGRPVGGIPCAGAPSAAHTASAFLLRPEDAPVQPQLDAAQRPRIHSAPRARPQQSSGQPVRVGGGTIAILCHRPTVPREKPRLRGARWHKSTQLGSWQRRDLNRGLPKAHLPQVTSPRALTAERPPLLAQAAATARLAASRSERGSPPEGGCRRTTRGPNAGGQRNGEAPPPPALLLLPRRTEPRTAGRVCPTQESPRAAGPRV
ncbi:proline-rich protein HaeIII subfamily 1-like [Eublepharis macularius]|uniref:Proline-rich protein HaeIII subfamily 1-like n=1 Tax=Eublepharis macularius TaxID=481883 RepID=A0AA97KAD4_EUBMA|nr:proline-rich protein HaeIII subfamily 1-like [Eublepharis macularius]